MRHQQIVSKHSNINEFMFPKLFRKTLAWLQMSREGTSAGCHNRNSFADLLMFVQLGVKDSLFDSQVRPYAHFKDLFLVNKLSDNLSSVKSFQETIFIQQVSSVASVSSLYIGQATWRNPDKPGAKSSSTGLIRISQHLTCRK